MDNGTLQRFSLLYASARYYGADRILRRHIGVADDYPIPLTIPHGVDFGQISGVYDIDSCEPVYWAFNKFLAGAAAPLKPVFAAPHPLLLATAPEPAPRREGNLVIGPPPGPENDRRMLECLRRAGILGCDILVKGRGNFEKSMQFWREAGFRPLVLGTMESASYDEMRALFGRYDEVVGGTLSSALFYAAALGAQVRLLRDYWYRNYEIRDLESSIQLSAAAVENVRILAGGNREQQGERSRSLLGADFDSSPETLRTKLESLLSGLAAPLHFPVRYPAPLRSLLATAALKTGRPGLIHEPLATRLRRAFRPRVVIMDVNEVSYWLEGPAGGNIAFSEVKFERGRTIPGNAVEAY
ncbi:MAG: hypothetical protein ACT4OE_05785 [Sphingosinicella sp.]